MSFHGGMGMGIFPGRRPMHSLCQGRRNRVSPFPCEDSQRESLPDLPFLGSGLSMLDLVGERHVYTRPGKGEACVYSTW